MNKKPDFLENLASLNKYYHEFYPLIPGALFIGCLALVYLGFYYLYKGQFPEFGMLVHGRWPLFAFIALFLVFTAFVAGNIFSRLSPKDPDIFGIYHHNVQRKRDGERSEVLQKALAGNTGSGSPNNDKKDVYNCIATIEEASFPTPDLYFIDRHWKLGLHYFSVHRLREQIDPDFRLQFPYPHMRQYLYYHNHGDLNFFVPWCWRRGCNRPDGVDGNKQIINGLKHRILEMNDPDVNLKLVQTECQVRLMSSMWHVLRVVSFPAYVFAGAVYVSCVIGAHNYFRVIMTDVGLCRCYDWIALFSCVCFCSSLAFWLIRPIDRLFCRHKTECRDSIKMLVDRICKLFNKQEACCRKCLQRLRRFLDWQFVRGMLGHLRCVSIKHNCQIASVLFALAILLFVWFVVGAMGFVGNRVCGDIFAILTPGVRLRICLIFLVVGAFAYYIFLRSKYELEYSVHYMRSREIFDIIDFAHILSFEQDGSLNRRFEDVVRKGKHFFAANCSHCGLCSKCQCFQASAGSKPPVVE